MSPLTDFRPRPRYLFATGPGVLPERVAAAMQAPILSHLDPQFHVVLGDIAGMLREVMNTRNELTLVAPGAGMAGMECAFVNLVEPGDDVVIGVHGAFGLRMLDIAERAGTHVTRVDAEWGRAVDPDAMREGIARAGRPKLVAVVHGETSTGVEQPLDPFGAPGDGGDDDGEQGEHRIEHTQGADPAVLGVAEERDRTPQGPAEVQAGHGGGDYFTTHYFGEAIRSGKSPYLDVYRGVAMSIVGALAWKSALLDGAPFTVPDFRDETQRCAYENDHWSPFPEDAGPGQPYPSIRGDIKPSAAAVRYARKIWKEIGYEGRD